MAVNDTPPASTGAGLLGSLQRLAGTVLELGQVRLELLGTEIEEQKLRALAALLWAAAGTALLGVGLAVLAAAVLATLWGSARSAAFAALFVIYIGAGAFALWRTRCSLRTPAGALAASAGELARDRSALSCASAAPSGERPRSSTPRSKPCCCLDSAWVRTAIGCAVAWYWRQHIGEARWRRPTGFYGSGTGFTRSATG